MSYEGEWIIWLINSWRFIFLFTNFLSSFFSLILHLYVLDNKLYGRACCGAGIVWSCLSGKASCQTTAYFYVLVLIWSFSKFIFLCAFFWGDNFRQSAWKLVKLLLSKRFFKTKGTRTGSCKRCVSLTTRMLSLWNIVSFLRLKRMNYTLIWSLSMFLKLFIVWSNITTSWIRGCRWYTSNCTHTRYIIKKCFSFVICKNIRVCPIYDYISFFWNCK